MKTHFSQDTAPQVFNNMAALDMAARNNTAHKMASYNLLFLKSCPLKMNRLFSV